MQKISTQTQGTAVFMVGIIIGLGLAAAAIWGDYEASSYFYSGAGYDGFNGLTCPILMSRGEKATVSARLDNTTDSEIKPFYEVEISGLAGNRSLENQVSVPAQSTRTATWSVDANDIDLGEFVMVKTDVLPVAGFATREATCGILVVNLLGFSGAQIVGGALAASLLCLVIGLGVRQIASQTTSARELSASNGMRAAGVTTLLAMLAGLMGWWLFGVLLCAVTLLLLVILLRYVAS